MNEIKIVLLEDHKPTRKALSFLAEKNMFKVVGETGKGSEAISLIKKTKPDVLILDLVLPEENTLELLSQVKKIFPELPVIVCSALQSEHIVTQVLEVGCFDYITKPFSEERFVQSIEKAVA